MRVHLRTTALLRFVLLVLIRVVLLGVVHGLCGSRNRGSFTSGFAVAVAIAGIVLVLVLILKSSRGSHRRFLLCFFLLLREILVVVVFTFVLAARVFVWLCPCASIAGRSACTRRALFAALTVLLLLLEFVDFAVVSAAAVSGTFRSSLIPRVFILLIVCFLSVSIVNRVVFAVLTDLTVFLFFLVIDVHVVIAGFFFILPRVVVWVQLGVVSIVSIVFVFAIFTG